MRLAIVPESVPAGYDFVGIETQSRATTIDAPARADFVLRAQRSVQGVLRGERAGETMSAPALGLDVTVDAEGRFVLRGLAAGLLDLVVQTPWGRRVQTVQNPRDPGRTVIKVVAP